MPERTSGVLVQDQIAAAIRDRITAGELQPGDPIPTLREIVDRWECSKTTAQAAVATLRAEGLITGGRGKSPVVKAPPHREQINLSAGWSQEQKDLVHQPLEVRKQRGAIEMTAGIPIDRTHSTHTYTTVPADEELSEVFAIEPKSPVVRRRYEMRNRETGVRLSYSTSWIPKHLIEAYPPLLDDAEEPWPGGHQHQLWTVGIEVDRFERTVHAAASTPEQQEAWNTTAPMLHVRSKSVDIHGRVVEMSDAEYPADRTEIAIDEKLARWPADHPRFDPAEDDR
ncbi:GntR family transcriptional regulator (plasmid) [Amycolatopsis sp. FU40]|uniref:GntR family transcriptional regulator n=1 Tax=Amycolatopsis sp. FU40 TaxID=2914159 RepID=UPI001F3EA858|nr:GntR family transcriptional regulator [Amycolatopsis sp. FU40]UKD50847.1 GntR family transcriptional regulator [Amycolatopsis sp. FU40]